jgi:Protein of unknown function (DUF2852)
MTSYASTAGWQAGQFPRPRRSSRRRWEIVGIIAGFIFMWPLALAYLVWKLLGYPVPNEARMFFERNFSRLSDGVLRSSWPERSTGNFAFDEYRRGELARLEQERRRLEEEAQGFAAFVEELKRAKDREEFDAFMAKRRGAQTA